MTACRSARSFSASAPISYNSGTGAFTFDSSGFLLKADNLSGLASASTAIAWRFTVHQACASGRPWSRRCQVRPALRVT